MTVRAALFTLFEARDGSVGLTWKGERLATRAGPYRLNRPSTS